MSFIGSMLGAGQGTGFTAQGPSAAQMSAAEQGGANALSQQQAFTQAIQAQSPQAMALQSQLAGQLQQQAAGQGPNPAQAQLAQATCANVASQAALMAGQRGAAGNVGLMARQAAQQGAGIQQQAAGQAATMGAQQQLAAQQQLQGLATSQMGQAQTASDSAINAALGNQGQYLGAQTGMNQAQVQASIQNSKAQQGIFGGLLGGAGSILAKGGMVGRDGKIPQPQKYADGGGVEPKSNVGKFLTGYNQATNLQGQYDSNPLQGGMQILASKAFGSLKGNSPSGTATHMGKEVASTNPAGQVGYNENGMLNPSASGPGLGVDTSMTAVPSSVPSNIDYSGLGGTSLGGVEAGSPEFGFAEGAGAADAAVGAADAGSASDIAALLARGGKVPAMVSPGEEFIPPSEVKKVAQGKENALKAGRFFQGKAKVPGDSLKNDTIKTKLETGGVVIPRHVMNSKDPAEQAKKFVQAVLAKQSLKRAA